MPTKCSALYCSNTDIPAVRKMGITFHRFPSDLTQRKSWFENVRCDDGKGGLWVPGPQTKVFLCSKHFEDSMFKVYTTIRTLKENACPTIFDFPSNFKESLMRRKRMAPEFDKEYQLPLSTKKIKRQTVDEALKQISKKKVLFKRRNVKEKINASIKDEKETQKQIFKKKIRVKVVYKTEEEAAKDLNNIVPVSTSDKLLKGGSDDVVLNLSGLRKYKLDRSPIDDSANASPTTVLNLDYNFIEELPTLYSYKSLTKVSLVNNFIDSLKWFKDLPSLQVLDLSGNKIVCLNWLSKLPQLKYLSLSRNRISTLKVQMQAPQNCLQFLDLSSNKITKIESITMLIALEELLLHKNKIETLFACKYFLPLSLTKLTLAENAIQSLGSLTELSSQSKLTYLSLNLNPCFNPLQLIDVEKPVGPPWLFDYRPFVLALCQNLKTIDGLDVQDAERSKSEWLLSEGKISQITKEHGCHDALVNYLSEVCPTVPQVTGLHSASRDSSTDKVPTPVMKMDLPLIGNEVPGKISTVRNNTSSLKKDSTASNREDCTSTRCKHYIELIEEKAKTHRLNRQNEEMVKRLHFMETLLEENELNIDDFLVKDEEIDIDDEYME